MISDVDDAIEMGDDEWGILPSPLQLVNGRGRGSREGSFMSRLRALRLQFNAHSKFVLRVL